MVEVLAPARLPRAQPLRRHLQPDPQAVRAGASAAAGEAAARGGAAADARAGAKHPAVEPPGGAARAADPRPRPGRQPGGDGLLGPPRRPLRVPRRPRLGARAHRVPERRATGRDDRADAAQRSQAAVASPPGGAGGADPQAGLRGARQRHPARHHRPVLSDRRPRRPCGGDADPALPAPARRRPLSVAKARARAPAHRRGDLARARRARRRSARRRDAGADRARPRLRRC